MVMPLLMVWVLQPKLPLLWQQQQQQSLQQHQKMQQQQQQRRLQQPYQPTWAVLPP